MKVGCPKEIKDNENRVGLTPNAVSAYVAAGHEVFIQKGAGLSARVTILDVNHRCCRTVFCSAGSFCNHMEFES